MPPKNKSVFDNLFAINANEFKEKKGKFDYLSWSDAVAYILKEYPEATWYVHEFDKNLGEDMGYIRQPFMSTEVGSFVKVSVTIDKIERTEILPVMNNYNKTIEKPTATDINNSIKRCLVKCFALFGLGLYIFQGEDLPEGDKPKEISDTQYKVMMKSIENKGAKYQQQVAQGIKTLKINTNNYDEYLKKFQEPEVKEKVENE
jgi:hypothetical protein